MRAAKAMRKWRGGGCARLRPHSRPRSPDTPVLESHTLLRVWVTEAERGKTRPTERRPTRVSRDNTLTRQPSLTQGPRRRDRPQPRAAHPGRPAPQLRLDPGAERQRGQGVFVWKKEELSREVCFAFVPPTLLPFHSQVVSLYEEISKSFVELVDGGANPPSASGGGPAAAAAVRGGDAPSSSPSAAGGREAPLVG